MSFEERLLMELKTEVATRGERRRRTTVRRLFAGAAVAGLAAAAAVAVPLLTGAERPAYAVSKSADGTVRVQIKEFRDADRLEGDLKRMGITADVSYTPPGKRCQSGRGRVLGGESATPEEWDKSPSAKAVLMRKDGIHIDPAHVAQGQTVVMEFAENDDQVSDKPQVLWQFAGKVIDGPVKPCVLVDDPLWNDVGGPEGQPPAGS
ncbi:hypothetical protein ACGF0J_17900 [Nonomuraea sp. NPDC047897]|uniref:hypothetical protein n=1 Tax=Nonomuraea sp. NPDC047897 TaxID=3364346 RepID=UPI003713D5DE